ADGVTGAAAAGEEILALGGLERPRLGVARAARELAPAEESADRGGEELRIVDRGIAHPLAARLVAYHEDRRVPVAIRGVAVARKPELLRHHADILGAAGEEGPTRADVELLHVGAQHVGRAVRRGE